MSPVHPHPASLLARPLVVAGMLSLAAITLMDRGASRMYATPWSSFYWIAIAFPLLFLVWRLWIPAFGARFTFPANGWLIWLASAAGTLVASAWFSPYRGPSLQWTALPLAGLATFLLVHDWLQADPVNRRRLANFSTLAAAVLMVASTGYWVADLTDLRRDQIFSKSLFEMRNAHPLGHSNYTAGLALLSLPWLVRATSDRRGARRMIAVVASALALLVLFTSGSRGGLLGLGVLGITALAMKRPGWKRFTLSAGAVVAAAAGLAIANPRIRALLTVPDGTMEPSISSVQRHAMAVAGFHMGADRPLLGWGNATTPLVYPRYRSVLDGGAENILQLHSTLVELWAGLGLAGVALGAGFLLLAARNWKHDPTAAAALAGYAAFALTDYQLDVPIFILALAALAASLAPPAVAAASTRARRWVALAILAALVLLTTTGRGDRTPALNAKALMLARDPARSGQAIALLRESLSLNPDQEIAHFNLGWLLLVPDPPSAERHFQAAARLVPDKGGVYFGLGLARLNQGNTSGAARALALECLNDPLFLASPWWTVPQIASERKMAATIFADLASRVSNPHWTEGWANQQAHRIAQLSRRLGDVSAGPEKDYRRERTGYPVLMRNLNIAPPIDLYDVREDPRFAASVPFPLPPKGWLPSPLLLKLLDDDAPPSH